jgi:hypothetical protein
MSLGRRGFYEFQGAEGVEETGPVPLFCREFYFQPGVPRVKLQRPAEKVANISWRD